MLDTTYEIHAMNTGVITSQLHISVSKPFKNHLKLPYSKCLLAENHILKSTGTIKKSQCRTTVSMDKDTTAMDLSRSDSQRF